VKLKIKKLKPANVVLSCFFIFFIILIFLLRKPLTTFAASEPFVNLVSFTPQKIAEFGGATTKVDVGMNIREIRYFNILSGDFVLDITIWFKFDHRLVFLDRIGKFKFDRAVILEKGPPYKSLVGKKTLVSYDMRIKLRDTLNYKRFPLDDHRIFITLTNFFLTILEVSFVAYNSNFTYNPEIQTQGWVCVGKSVRTGFLERDIKLNGRVRKEYYPRIVFALDFERSGIRNILTIVIPLLIIFFISSITLAIEHTKENKTRLITMAIASVTAIIAYRFIIDNMSPKTGYFMISDHFFFLFLFACCVIIIFNVFGERISNFYKSIFVLLLYVILTMASIVILYAAF